MWQASGPGVEGAERVQQLHQLCCTFTPPRKVVSHDRVRTPPARSQKCGPNIGKPFCIASAPAAAAAAAVKHGFRVRFRSAANAVAVAVAAVVAAAVAATASRAPPATRRKVRRRRHRRPFQNVAPGPAPQPPSRQAPAAPRLLLVARPGSARSAPLLSAPPEASPAIVGERISAVKHHGSALPSDWVVRHGRPKTCLASIQSPKLVAAAQDCLRAGHTHILRRRMLFQTGVCSSRRAAADRVAHQGDWDCRT